MSCVFRWLLSPYDSIIIVMIMTMTVIMMMMINMKIMMTCYVRIIKILICDWCMGWKVSDPIDPQINIHSPPHWPQNSSSEQRNKIVTNYLKVSGLMEKAQKTCSCKTNKLNTRKQCWDKWPNWSWILGNRKWCILLLIYKRVISM